MYVLVGCKFPRQARRASGAPSGVAGDSLPRSKNHEAIPCIERARARLRENSHIYIHRGCAPPLSRNSRESTSPSPVPRGWRTCDERRGGGGVGLPPSPMLLGCLIHRENKKDGRSGGERQREREISLEEKKDRSSVFCVGWTETRRRRIRECLCRKYDGTEG